MENLQTGKQVANGNSAGTKSKFYYFSILLKGYYFYRTPTLKHLIYKTQNLVLKQFNPRQDMSDAPRDFSTNLRPVSLQKEVPSSSCQVISRVSGN